LVFCEARGKGGREGLAQEYIDPMIPGCVYAEQIDHRWDWQKTGQLQVDARIPPPQIHRCIDLMRFIRTLAFPSLNVTILWIDSSTGSNFTHTIL
jgi:hypothetical protein